MHPRQDGTTRPIVKRLAEIAATDQGQSMLRLLAWFSCAPRGGAVVSDAARERSNGDAAIGIWKPKVEDGRTIYVREASNEPRRFWADVERIEAASAAPRVVLLGESVARGYYYDPEYNPAAAIKSMMRAGGDLKDAEVVDLARVDCSRDMLLRLARASLALKPVAWVVFAGNNWNPYLDLDFEQYQEVAEVLAGSAGWIGVREYIEKTCRSQVREFVRSLASLSTAHGVPAVLVIPEFNLRDWRNEYGAGIPLLSGADAKRWHELRQAAESAVEEGQWGEATGIATSMLALDRGGATRTYEILAHSRLASGDLEEARSLLEKARDTGLSVPVRRSPRCFGAVQDEMRSASRSNGVACVDLPRCFSEYSDGALPDHTLFHDYCHLTAEGIRVAGARIVETLLPLMAMRKRNWRELCTAAPQASPKVLAQAYFTSAIHNARWGQSYETIRRQCERAVSYSPDIVDTMRLCLDCYVRAAPAVLCRSFDDMTKQGTLAVAHFVSMTGDPGREKLLNPALVDAMTAVIAGAGAPAHAEVMELLISEHGVTSQPRQLLATPYCCTSCADPEFGWLQRSGVFKAHDAKSSFTFVGRLGATIHCSLTYRMPVSGSDLNTNALGVELNGEPAALLPGSQGWRTKELHLGPEFVRDGWNSIQLLWPQPCWTEDEHIGRIVTSLSLGEIPELFPVYGELHSFTICGEARPE